MQRTNIWKILSIILVILLAASFFFGFAGGYGQFAGSTLFTKTTLNSDDAAKKTLDFINNNLLSGGEEATLVNVSERSGVYHMFILLSSPSGGNLIEVYMTKDGSTLFPAAYTIAKDLQNPVVSSQVRNGQETAKKNCTDIKKQDSPVMQAFVVSYCPYGTQMQTILSDIVDKIPALSENIKVRYIGDISGGKVYSMHGQQEADENLRQICIREEQGSRYWWYVSCFIQSGTPDTCMQKSGIDANKTQSCMADAGRGITYAKEDFAIGAQYRISGSPTLLLNNEIVREFDFGGRTPEAVKTLLCCGFLTQPDGCLKTLSTEQAGTGSNGQC